LALPAGICSLIKPTIFFAFCKPRWNARRRSVSNNARSPLATDAPQRP
jgi:hypothetical protein